jgi:hypothetical protein
MPRNSGTKYRFIGIKVIICGINEIYRLGLESGGSVPVPISGGTY